MSSKECPGCKNVLLRNSRNPIVMNCSSCTKKYAFDCIRCHRIFEDFKYLSIDEKRCYACHNKYMKEKKKALINASNVVSF